MNDVLSLQPGGLLQGKLRVPGDKSISHRAILLASISEGVSDLQGLLDAGDTRSTIKAMQSMGVRIEQLAATHWRIHGVGLRGLTAPQGPIDCGNSGTLMRLLTGILVGQSFDSELTGDASLLRRPMGRIVEPLTQMGAHIEMSLAGTAPLKIRGAQPLQGIHYELPIVSAQIKSCLLLAGLYAEGATDIIEPMVSRNHTELMLEAFGHSLDRHRPHVTLQSMGRLVATSFTIPGDISAAAFFMVGATIAPGSDVILENVGLNSTRIGVINILTMMGAKIKFENERDQGSETIADVHVRYAPLHGIDVPMEQVPLAIDEFPILFIAAAVATGTTTVRGAQELRLKESDRIALMAEGLTAMGVPVEVHEDGIMIEGVKQIKGAEVDSDGDHRIAMAFAIAALITTDPMVIKNCDKVGTSYPNFVRDAHALGLKIQSNSPSIPVITIDGPSGTGKGTLGRQVANALGWHFLDSGALYRVLAFAVLDRKLAQDDWVAIEHLAEQLPVAFEFGHHHWQVLYEGRDVVAELSSEKIGHLASQLAAVGEVRTALLARQRAFREAPGLVTDGRDMGTVIFPDAQLKIYLHASPEIRAERRYKQLKASGLAVKLPEILQELAARDARDSQRQIAPLKAAENAVIIDTSELTAEEVLAKVLVLASERL